VSGLKEQPLSKVMWKNFVMDGRDYNELDPLVKKMWGRSRKKGVNPFQNKGEIDLKRLNESLNTNRNLVEFSIPLMEKLYNFVKGSGFLVNLCDKDGLILKVIGDRDIVKEAKMIDFVEGADWSEEALGTNAIGSCIIERKPLQIISHEHYCEMCHQWTCSASPIHNSDNKIIGVLNMSGPSEKAHPHTLGMVVSTVHAIENEIFLHEKSKHNEMMKSILEATTNTLATGMIIVNNQGEIIKVNKAFTSILNVKEDVTGKTINEIFESDFFKEMTSSDKEVSDAELKLKLTIIGSSKDVLLSKKSIYQAGQRIGSLFTFKEIKKVRQLVNQLSGNRAKITFEDIIGQNAVFQSRINEAKLASKTTSNVLLLGESGTGKDLFAQAIHNQSDRCNKPFIVINCGAIPRELLGSELFGYVDGAFTGARKGGSSGKFELADGGTIFLDEIGEMPLDMQVVLLRVLQNKEVVRIGGQKVIPVDVRIISATNKDLKEEVKNGNFREDLFFRLNVMPIKIPSLRERKDDIPILTDSFINECIVSYSKKISTITPNYHEALIQYDWPGNIRELNNVVERSINQVTGDVLDVSLLPEEFSNHDNRTISSRTEYLPKKEEIKKQALQKAIIEHKYNYSRAAKSLGIARSTLYRQLDRYGLRNKQTKID
jgi:sigma-54 dependent transcriptional regulator, acetoin dehydrogenase operon transcriptional activator AcoR